MSNAGAGARRYSRGQTLGDVALGGRSKRAVDLFIAILAVVLLAPLLLAVVLLIRVVIGTPIILAERRIGLGGKHFSRYAFRTAPDEDAPADGPMQAIAGCLRASGIDKLPQLFNVVRGDMSLVGPEPLTPEVSHCTEVPEILLVRPGVTGLRHHIPRRLRQQISETGSDRLYILRWSMWLDLRIVCGALARIHAQDASSPAR